MAYWPAAGGRRTEPSLFSAALSLEKTATTYLKRLPHAFMQRTLVWLIVPSLASPPAIANSDPPGETCQVVAVCSG